MLAGPHPRRLSRGDFAPRPGRGRCCYLSPARISQFVVGPHPHDLPALALLAPVARSDSLLERDSASCLCRYLPAAESLRTVNRALAWSSTTAMIIAQPMMIHS